MDNNAFVEILMEDMASYQSRRVLRLVVETKLKSVEAFWWTVSIANVSRSDKCQFKTFMSSRLFYINSLDRSISYI